jgi:hypothetical protein
MRFARQLVVAAIVAAGLVVAGGGVAGAQLGSCNGNKVVDHAPYDCTDTKDISGITFTITLNVDAAGKATVLYTMSPVQQADVPVAVHSYTDISLGPKQFVDGTIIAGQTTTTVVVPRIECGQLDIKAVFTTPGDSQGNIAGPVVTWGDVCQTAPTTTTPTTVTPSSVSPSSVSPTNVASTIPATGTAGVVPWTWALPPLTLAAFLIFLSRFRRPSPR